MSSFGSDDYSLIDLVLEMDNSFALLLLLFLFLCLRCILFICLLLILGYCSSIDLVQGLGLGLKKTI